MKSSTPEGETVVARPPSPVPSPPPLSQSFETALNTHFFFYSSATATGNILSAKESSLPGDWRLSLKATFISNHVFSLRDFPAHLLPFFAYKDVALYVPGRYNASELFDAIYREWYPTRDRTVFDDGVFRGCGGPFFSFTMRVEFKDSTPQPPDLLKHLVRWHVALSRHLNHLLPRFETLAEGARNLVRPGLTDRQLQGMRALPVRTEYTPVIRRTFTECFMWVDRGWETEGVRLVVLSEDLQRRILSGACQGLARDLDMEEKIRGTARLGPDNGKERGEGEMNEQLGVDAEVSMDHVSVWKASLEDAMKAVVAGDEARRKGHGDLDRVLEWVGDGLLNARRM